MDGLGGGLQDAAGHVLVGRFEIEHHGALGVEMVGNGARILKPLRLDEHHLELRSGVDVHDLVAAFGIIRRKLFRRFGGLGDKIHILLLFLLEVVLDFRINNAFEFIKQSHGIAPPVLLYTFYSRLPKRADPIRTRVDPSRIACS